MKKAYLSLILVCLIPAAGLSYLIGEAAKSSSLPSVALAFPAPLQLSAYGE